jgi:hypothetical protein
LIVASVLNDDNDGAASPSSVSTTELNAQFTEKFSSSSVLVDFQEKYIQKRLASQRLEDSGANDANNSWNETMDSRPEFALASLRQLSEAAKAVAKSTSTGTSTRSTSNIREVDQDYDDVVLSAASRAYARFIPSVTPTLRYDS